MTAVCPAAWSAATMPPLGTNRENAVIIGDFVYRINASGRIERRNWDALDGATEMFVPPSGHIISCLTADDSGNFYWIDKTPVSGSDLRTWAIIRSTDFADGTGVIFSVTETANFFHPPPSGSDGQEFFWNYLAWSPVGYLFLTISSFDYHDTGVQFGTENALALISTVDGSLSGLAYIVSNSPGDPGPRRYLDGGSSMVVTPDGAVWGSTQGSASDGELWRYMLGGSVQFFNPAVDLDNFYMVGVAPTPDDSVYVSIWSLDTFDPTGILEVSSSGTMTTPTCGFTAHDLDDYQTLRGWRPDFSIITFGNHTSGQYWRWFVEPPTREPNIRQRQRDDVARSPDAKNPPTSQQSGIRAGRVNTYW